MSLTVYGQLAYPTISVRRNYNGSINNIIPQYMDRYLWGYVDGINYLGNMTIGQNIMFDSNGAILVTQAAVEYYLVDETTIPFIENTPT